MQHSTYAHGQKGNDDDDDDDDNDEQQEVKTCQSP
jgi:hypothetical protein